MKQQSLGDPSRRGDGVAAIASSDNVGCHAILTFLTKAEILRRTRSVGVHTLAKMLTSPCARFEQSELIVSELTNANWKLMKVISLENHLRAKKDIPRRIMMSRNRIARVPKLNDIIPRAARFRPAMRSRKSLSDEQGERDDRSELRKHFFLLGLRG